jgi:hypothetical protein
MSIIIEKRNMLCTIAKLPSEIRTKLRELKFVRSEGKFGISFFCMRLDQVCSMLEKMGIQNVTLVDHDKDDDEDFDAEIEFYDELNRGFSEHQAALYEAECEAECEDECEMDYDDD